MSNWRGTNHSRMTRSMEWALSPAEFKIIAVLRRSIRDGQRRRISQREIARRARVSESTVSVAIRRLDGIYLQRRFIGRGRGGGYEIEMLPPPEMRHPRRRTPQNGSLSDPFLDPQELGIETRQTAPKDGSLSDPSILYDHDHEQQQQTAPPTKSDQLAPETIAALEQAGAHPSLIARIAANSPTCSPADVAAAIEAAEQKPNSHTPLGLALECLARAQRVIAPRPRRDSVDWGALNAEAARRAAGEIESDPDPDLLPADADEIDFAPNPLDIAIQILAKNEPNFAEGIFLRQCLASGDSPEHAAAALQARRAAIPRPEDRVVPTVRRRQGRNDD